MQALMVEAPGLKLVVDTCIGNDKPRRMTRGIGLNKYIAERIARPLGMNNTASCSIRHAIAHSLSFAVAKPGLASVAMN